jgi:hypothetical protein
MIKPMTRTQQKLVKPMGQIQGQVLLEVCFVRSGLGLILENLFGPG